MLNIADRGLLITFEGLDKAGKTTQAQLLESQLNKMGQSARIIRFPERTTAVGKTIDSYLKGSFKTEDEVIHMLFSANRWEFKDKIVEELGKGTHLILDRYAYSGVAFSAAKGLDLEWCKNCDKGLPRPDFVFFLEISEKEGKERGDYGKEVYEREEFQKLVKEKYLALRESNWVIINANDSIEEINARIMGMMEGFLKEKRGDGIKKLWV